MTRLPACTPEMAIRALGRAGFFLDHSTGSHRFYRHPDRPGIVTVVGWRFINERRAVNLDPNCGWARGKAAVLYVPDAFEVMRKVNALLGGR